MKWQAITHRKMTKLARMLGTTRRDAVGLMEMLWHYAAENAPRGNIGICDDVDIAKAVDWEGEVDELLRALCACGWIDSSKRYRLLIHDWGEHSPDYLRKRLYRRGLTFIGAADARRTRGGQRRPRGASTQRNATQRKKPPKAPLKKADCSDKFQEWWDGYRCRTSRKKGVETAWKLWNEFGLEAIADDVIACVEALKKSKDWKEESGRYIPGPVPWLRTKPWKTTNFAKDAADGTPPAITPDMRPALPEKEAHWSFKLTKAERQGWLDRAAQEIPDQPHVLVVSRAKELAEEDRLRAAGKE